MQFVRVLTGRTTSTLLAPLSAFALTASLSAFLRSAFAPSFVASLRIFSLSKSEGASATARPMRVLYSTAEPVQASGISRTTFKEYTSPVSHAAAKGFTFMGLRVTGQMTLCGRPDGPACVQRRQEEGRQWDQPPWPLPLQLS